MLHRQNTATCHPWATYLQTIKPNLKAEHPKLVFNPTCTRNREQSPFLRAHFNFTLVLNLPYSSYNLWNKVFVANHIPYKINICTNIMSRIPSTTVLLYSCRQSTLLLCAAMLKIFNKCFFFSSIERGYSYHLR